MCREASAQTRNTGSRFILLPVTHVLPLAEGIDPIVEGVEHLDRLLTVYIDASRQVIFAAYDLEGQGEAVCSGIGRSRNVGVVVAVVAVLHGAVYGRLADYAAVFVIIGRRAVHGAVIDLCVIHVAGYTAGCLIAVYVHAHPAVFDRTCSEKADYTAGIVVCGYAAADADVFDDRLLAVDIAEQSSGIVSLIDYQLVYNIALAVKDALEAVGLAAAYGHPALALVERAVYDDAQVCREEEGSTRCIVALVYELCEHFELFNIAYAVAYAGLSVGFRLIKRFHRHTVCINGCFGGVAGVCQHWIPAADAVNAVGIGVKCPFAPPRAAVCRDPCIEQCQKIVAGHAADGLLRFGRAHRGAGREAHGVYAAGRILAADIVIGAVIGMVDTAYLCIRHFAGNGADVSRSAYLAVVCAVYDLTAGDDSGKAAVIARAVYANRAPAVHYLAGEDRGDARGVSAVGYAVYAEVHNDRIGACVFEQICYQTENSIAAAVERSFKRVLRCADAVPGVAAHVDVPLQIESDALCISAGRNIVGKRYDIVVIDDTVVLPGHGVGASPEKLLDRARAFIAAAVKCRGFRSEAKQSQRHCQAQEHAQHSFNAVFHAFVLLEDI